MDSEVGRRPVPLATCTLGASIIRRLRMPAFCTTVSRRWISALNSSVVGGSAEPGLFVETCLCRSDTASPQVSC
jgi:hypothetical protein